MIGNQNLPDDAPVLALGGFVNEGEKKKYKREPYQNENIIFKMGRFTKYSVARAPSN